MEGRILFFSSICMYEIVPDARDQGYAIIVNHGCQLDDVSLHQVQYIGSPPQREKVAASFGVRHTYIGHHLVWTSIVARMRLSARN